MAENFLRLIRASGVKVQGLGSLKRKDAQIVSDAAQGSAANTGSGLNGSGGAGASTKPAM